MGSVKHWSTVVNQAVVQRAPNGSFNLCIEGGSEYGQFVVIGDVLTEVNFRSGSLSPGEIILEINGMHVAGYTQTDGITLIRDSGSLLHITSVQPGQGITRDLRKYLSTRFPRGSLDHELQQTIRDNLYMRTVPCTTRKPREGEVPGIDYEFLTVNEYLELEKSGKLLESGFYESNYYGTPKPPKQPMTPGTGTLRNPKMAKKQFQERAKSAGDVGPLPSNWEMAYTKEGEPYFVDHNSGKTQWDDPRRSKAISVPKLNNVPVDDPLDDDLPTGWEKVDDPKYGTYYIDHINRRTQYEKPEVPAVRKTSQVNRNLNREPDHNHKDFDTQSRKSNMSIDARKLQGETLRISLRKAAKGFGFTIVGGEQQGEVLQVNNIVRGGAADIDGRLRTGDIVMRLNGRNVLSWSHSDIIRFLQTTRVGEMVELDVVRGYPLPYDNTDETVSNKNMPSILNGHANREHMKRAMSNGSINVNDLPRQNNMSHQRSIVGSKSTGYLSDGDGYKSDRALRPTTPTAFRSGPPQYRTVKVVRGPSGFGFTIADSPYGQRVKEIVDRQRCQDLVQGDVIIRINSHVVHNLDHADVVEVLKGCPKGQATSFQVQRSGVLTVVKSMPVPLAGRRNHAPQRPKSMTSLDRRDEPEEKLVVKPSTSMGVIATNGEVSSENITTTYEERNHPQVSAAGDGYKSLKRAVQTNARDIEGGVTEHLVTLKRGTGGFGFRIIGGQEEKTQVKIDTIVSDGEADKDGRLRQGDIILAVDGINVVDATHKRVISLMNNAALNGKVTLRVRRKTEAEDAASDAAEEQPDDAPPAAPTQVNGFRLMNELGEKIEAMNTTTGSGGNNRERRKSDTESIHSDKQVKEWIEDHQHQRDQRPINYRSQSTTSDTLRSKSENNVNKPKAGPPPVAPKPRTTSTSGGGGVEMVNGGGGARGTEITLNRNSNEGFGFVIMSSPSSKGSVIGRIIPGSPSDRCGLLSVDDKLLAVNDQDVSRLSHSEIVSLVKNSGLQVKICIARPGSPDDEGGNSPPPPPRPVEPRNYTPSMHSYNKQTDNLREDYTRLRHNIEDSRNREMRENGRPQQYPQPARPKSAPPINNGEEAEPQRPKPVTISSHHQQKDDRKRVHKKSLSSNEPVSITLQKGDKGFGFSIRGGNGEPLAVLRIAENGAAAIDGRIKVGDQILQIDDQNAENMSHAEAVNTIRNCSEQTTLLIRRPLLDEPMENGQR